VRGDAGGSALADSFDLGHRLVDAVSRDVYDDDGRAFANQAMGDRSSDPGTGAGDDGGSSHESIFHGILPTLSPAEEDRNVDPGTDGGLARSSPSAPATHPVPHLDDGGTRRDRKSTRLNSSH